MKTRILFLGFALFFIFYPHLINSQANATPTVYDPNYTCELVASGLGAVTGVKLGPEGNIFLTDYLWGRILKIDKDTYQVETYASGFT